MIPFTVHFCTVTVAIDFIGTHRTPQKYFLGALASRRQPELFVVNH
jgi:hypothetical protein